MGGAGKIGGGVNKSTGNFSGNPKVACQLSTDIFPYPNQNPTLTPIKVPIT